jgi:hypothetical protein
MSTWHATQALEKAAHKWRGLAERRRAYFVELYSSGRWKHYYASEEDFLLRMHNVMNDVDRWAEVARPTAKMSTDLNDRGSKAERRQA